MEEQQFQPVDTDDESHPGSAELVFEGRAGLRIISGGFAVRSRRPDAFVARSWSLTSGDAAVRFLRATEHEAVRGPAQIEEFPELRLLVTCLLDGEIRAKYADRLERLSAPSLTVVRGDVPVAYIADSPIETCSILLPRQLCPPNVIDPSDLPDGPIRVGRLAEVLGPVLAALSTDGLEGGDLVEHYVVRSVVDLTVATLSEATSETSSPGSGKDGLRQRIRTHIDQRLHDSTLGPTSIAAHFGVSVRSLHLLFSEQDETCARYIRNRRLDGVAATLATSGPAMTSRVLCERFGFTNRDQLSRSFRARFGVSMQEYRGVPR